jgi:hypothetical protein
VLDYLDTKSDSPGQGKSSCGLWCAVAGIVSVSPIPICGSVHLSQFDSMHFTFGRVNHLGRVMHRRLSHK